MMNEKRYELDKGSKGQMIYDHEGVDDYYFINDPEELKKFVDSLNDSENTWKENYNHVMGEYKKQLIQINEKDLEISKLKKEIQELKINQQLTYKETESREFKGNKLYIKDTHTELKMEENKMYITCQIPFNDGTPQIRKHKFGVVGIYHDW